MRETKTVRLSLSLVLLVAASYCIYQAHTEKKVGHNSEINSEGSCKNWYRKFCLKSGESYYPFDEGMVRCKRTWFGYMEENDV